MADFDSSLPVRTENATDVKVSIADNTITSRFMTVNADGSINVNTTDFDIRDLVFATDKVDVSGSSVELGATTLAALESITVQNGAGAAAVNIQDGGNSITVDGTFWQAVQPVSATDLDIRDLVFATDKVDVSGSTVLIDASSLAALESITVQNPAGAGAVNIQDGGNSITVDGTFWQAVQPVSATDLDIRDLVFATDKVDVSGSVVALDAPTLAALESITVQNGAGAAAVNIQDGGNSITVDGVDFDIRDLSHSQDSIKIGDGTDFLAVNTDGSINVVIADATPGTSINDYDTQAALAADATDNHDYTVTAGKTFYFNQVEASGTGKMKIEVMVETGVATGTFLTKFVQFNSTANANMSIHIDNPITVAAGVRVRIARTNRENQPQDVYSTISGYELP